MSRRTFVAATGVAAAAPLLPVSWAAAAPSTIGPPRGSWPRARDLGVPFEGTPGPLNAVTDVAGVGVEHVTLIRGDGPLVVGRGPVRTGLTAILPRPDGFPVFAGRYDLNGTGELTGCHVIDELGYLIGPIITTNTNTNSVGTARDAAVAWAYRRFGPDLGFLFSEAVVGECHDGTLNDIVGRHVQDAHVDAALDALAAGGGTPAPVTEGNVGGGTGMVCHEFKGGIGTSSRRLPRAAGGHTVGVLVQANQGYRATLTIAGVPVGKEITDLLPEHGAVGRRESRRRNASSIIVVVGTDAPLLPHQLDQLARRSALGVGLVGGHGEDFSGDICVAFSTAHVAALPFPPTQQVEMVTLSHTEPLYHATVQAAEEAIVNALVAARTMTGINGVRVHALPHDRLRQVLRRYRRLAN